MLTLVWMSTAAVWAGHVGLLFADNSLLFQLLAGHAPVWLNVAALAALLPQLILIPWAWHDSGKRALSKSSRVTWRVCFFVSGFLATTVYALKYRAPASER